MVVVGEERERLIARLAEALGRHWGSSSAGPRGLAAESVLQAPALVLVFSMVPPSEGAEAFGVVAGAVQSMMLLGHVERARHASHPLRAHGARGGARLRRRVPRPADPRRRSGDAVRASAGRRAESRRCARSPSASSRSWVGDGAVPLDDMPSTPSDDLRPPADGSARARPRARARRRSLSVQPRAPRGAAHARRLRGRGLLRRRVAAPARRGVGHAPRSTSCRDTLRDTHGFELVRRLTGGGEDKRAPVIVTAARRDSAFRIAGLSRRRRLLPAQAGQRRRALHRGAHPRRSPPARRRSAPERSASCARPRGAWCSTPRWRRSASSSPAWRTRSTRRWPPW